ncbi:hypothetical protein [Streptomyces platensis]|uniref:hypothetical protein n=1 Tax=Streptomyces platensis TaxID=58346 RepID=UPI002E818140|nr:hypothetical protein [Streptomyces platensis]WUB81157.1 hypothetical protein OG424_19385 [Streptomyces platensis]
MAGQRIAQSVLDPAGRLQQIGERDQGAQPGLGVRLGGELRQHPLQDLGALVGAAERAEDFCDGELGLGEDIVLPMGRLHVGECAEFRQGPFDVAAVPLSAGRHQSSDEVEPADTGVFGGRGVSGYFRHSDPEAFGQDLERPATGNTLPVFDQRDITG